MQKNHPETPKLRRIRRNRNVVTPEPGKKNIADTTLTKKRTISQARATMAPTDFMQSHNFLPPRRIGLDRMSLLPSQLPSEGPRSTDVDCDDTELMLLYNEYLQKLMTEIVIKKKAEERKNSILTQLATIAKEHAHDEEKLFKLKTRERDIINLTIAQNEIDAQVTDVNNSIKNEEIKTLKDTLSQLYTLLQPFDMIRCNNIVLPETPEEWAEIERTLQTCGNTLKSIMDLIGDKGDTYRTVCEKLKDFTKSYNDIGNAQKRLQKALLDLQVLTLKVASLSVADQELADI